MASAMMMERTAMGMPTMPGMGGMVGPMAGMPTIIFRRCFCPMTWSAS